MKPAQKRNKKTYKEKYLVGVNSLFLVQESYYFFYCSETFAQVSLKPTVLLNTNFSADDSLSTQK